VTGYRLTKAAADDVAAIFLEGSAQFGLDLADRYHEEMAATFDFLAEYLGGVVLVPKLLRSGAVR